MSGSTTLSTATIARTALRDRNQNQSASCSVQKLVWSFNRPYSHSTVTVQSQQRLPADVREAPPRDGGEDGAAEGA
eukprot:5751350-Pyramimonas_sp.AAC.1